MILKKVFSIVAVLALTVFLGAGALQASMWVGPEIGPNFSSNMTTGSSATTGTGYTLRARAGISTGLMIGYEFNNHGAGAYNYPEWMRYFGVAFGVSYNPLNFTSQAKQAIVTSTFATNGVQKTTTFMPVTGNVDGSNVLLSFLVIGKVPFMVSEEYPGGKIAPYVAVGPGILFTNLDFTPLGGDNRSSTNVAFITEAGIRYMITPSFSADIAYRYRYARPSIDVTLPGIGNSRVLGAANTHQALFRVAYHF